jgi:hypothetical protein
MKFDVVDDHVKMPLVKKPGLTMEFCKAFDR